MKSIFKGNFVSKTANRKVDVKVDLIEFQEDNVWFAFSPALDLIGYGENQIEARKSWEVILQEYITYAINKKTLTKDLQHRGWQIRNNKTVFKPPTFSWMLQNNSQLKDVFNNLGLTLPDIRNFLA